MKFKKCISWIMAMAIAVTLLSTGAFTAAAADEVKFSLSNAEVMLGQEVVVDIHVNGTVAAFSANLSYNRTALSLKTIENIDSRVGDFSSVGTDFIGFTGSSNVSMNGVTWKCTFEARTTAAVGTYPIGLTTPLAFTTSGGEAISQVPASVTPGSITVKALNWVQYDQALANKNAVTDGTPYTEKSYQKYLDAINGFTPLNKSDYGIPQATIDAATKQMNDALSLLVLKTDEVKVEGISFGEPNAALNTGDTKTLTPVFNPGNATDKDVKWKSSDESVVTVDANGVIKAVGPGTAVITATSDDGGFTASVTVTVTQLPGGVTLNKSTLSLKVGGASETLVATVSPANASNKAVTWKSSDPAVASVTNGVVKPLKAGKTTITVTTVDGGKTATCAVTVTSSDVAVTKVAITGAPANMVNEKTKTATLKATITPTNATNKTVTWTSSDAKIATVNKTTGVVTPVGVGTVTITATAGGKSASCKITVHQYVTLRVGKTQAVQNGKLTSIDNIGTKPFKVGIRTMVPIRFVAEKMGGKVNYISKSKPITMTFGTKKVELMLNSKTMKVYNGSKLEKTVTLDVPAQLKGTKTYVPLRAISNALGFTVYYENGTEYIVVNSPAMTSAVRDERLAEGKKYIKK